MAGFSLVHGAWHGGWCWDLLRAELEARGHDVDSPDLPCDDPGAGVAQYVAAVPPSDVVVGLAALAARLRRQAPYDPPTVEPPGSCAYVVCSRDAVIRPDWQRHPARDVLGVEPIELEAGHSPMLERPAGLAAILHALA